MIAVFLEVCPEPDPNSASNNFLTGQCFWMFIFLGSLGSIRHPFDIFLLVQISSSSTGVGGPGAENLVAFTEFALARMFNPGRKSVDALDTSGQMLRHGKSQTSKIFFLAVA